MRSRRPKRRRRKSEAITLNAVPGTTLLSTETGGRGERERTSPQAGVYLKVFGRATLTLVLCSPSQAAHAYRI